MTLSYTKNLHLAVPDFLTEPWHSEFAQAMDSIDQLIYQAIVLAGAELWENDHIYTVGDIVISPDTGGLFSAAETHQSSPAPTLFSQEIIFFPSRWTPVATILASQAEAEAGVENTKYMSPLRTKQAIEKQRPLISIATQVEAEAGSENTHQMTPLRTAQAIAVRTSGVPQGRLSCLYDTPVMNVDVLATTTVYYTQYTGQTLPIYNGSRYEVTDFWDALVGYASDNIKSPVGIGADKINDWFIWKDSTEVVISSASPCVITFPSPHALPYNNPIQFAPGSILPSPLIPDKTYYVISAGITATTCEISDTLQGTPINTSGPQTGPHTINMRRLTHGPDWANDNTRAAGGALIRIRGIWLNASDILNGPKAQRATYIGSTRSDPGAGGTFTWKFGKADPTDPHGWHGIWNLYNRRPVVSSARYSKASWTYQSATAREIDNTTTNRIYILQGLSEDGSRAQHFQMSQGVVAQSNARPLIKVTPDPGGGVFTPNGYRSSATDITGQRQDTATWAGLPLIGWITFAAAEQCVQTIGVTTMLGAFALGQNQSLEVTFTA